MKPSDQRQVFKDIKNLKESVKELDNSDEIKKLKKEIKSLKKKVAELLKPDESKKKVEGLKLEE